MNTPEERCAMFAGALHRRVAEPGEYEPPPAEWSRSAKVAYAHGWRTGHTDCACHEPLSAAGTLPERVGSTDNPIIDMAVSAIQGFAGDAARHNPETALAMWRYSPQLNERERSAIIERLTS